MEGGAAGGRGGAGGARGKSKKARARAKAAAASAAAAALAASAALAKQSGGKKVAAVDGAQAPAAAKIKALKTAKAGKAATTAGVQVATAAGAGVATRLTRKKLAGAKSVAKLKMGTVAAAAALAPAAPKAAPKKRATTKKQQQQQQEEPVVTAVAVAPAAVLDSVTHAHSAAITSELETSRAHDAAATSTVVSLTGGKRARGKKRRASSLGASDHELSSPAAAAAAESAASTPTPVAAATAAEHVASVHVVHPHHIVDLNKHSPSTEPRIAFLGGTAARDNAKQDSVIGATSYHQVAPPASMLHVDNPTSTASPTARPANTKKVKIVKKGSVRAKPVGNGSEASKKTQVTKVDASKMTTRLRKKTAESQLQPNITESAPSVALSVLAATTAATDHSIIASSSPLKSASGSAVTRLHVAQTSTDVAGSTVDGQEANAADVLKQRTRVATEAASETSGSTSRLVDSAPLAKSPIREKQPAPPHSQLLQQQSQTSGADSPASSTPEAQLEPVANTLKIPTPVMTALRSELAPAQPPTTSKSSEVLDAAPIITASVVRSDSKEGEAITTSVKMDVAVSAPIPQSKTSATKKEPPVQVSTEAPKAQTEHANSIEQESTINAQKSGLPLVEDLLPPSLSPVLSPVEEVIEKQAPEPVATPSATHPDATPTVTSSLPRVTIPEPVLSEKEPRDGEDDGDGVTSPATQALRRIFSGEMKRLLAVRFERLSAITEHPTSELKTKAKTSKKRRREDDSTGKETSQLQTVVPHRLMVAAHRPTVRKPAPKEPPSFGIIMDSHAYVAKMMRSDPVANPTPTNEEPVQRQTPTTLPSNSWGASFGFAGGAAMSNLSVPSSPRSPLASTRPLSSWFLSKGAANFVKRVSFRHELSAFGNPEPSKRRRVSVASEDGTSSRTASSGGESEENAFLASLTSQASWRSWYTSDDKKPADSLLDPIPTSRLPRELLDLLIEPMALDDGGEPASPPSTDATATTGASTTTVASTGRASELERLEQEIRAEKRRARAFERMLLLALQGKAASGREFEDEYGSALAPSRPSRQAK